MSNLQKMGGISGLLHAAALVVGMVLGVTLIFPIINSDPGQYTAFVANNHTLMYLWNLIAYWVFAITLVVMALALYERVKTVSPALAQTATVFGLIWAGLIIGSGNLMLHDLGVVANLHRQDPVQAQSVWVVLEAVENGIVSGNELVGSLWVLLISLAAWKTGALPRALSCLGVAISLAGILTLVPAFVETMLMIFGPGLILWSIWVGIALLRKRPAATNA